MASFAMASVCLLDRISHQLDDDPSRAHPIIPQEADLQGVGGVLKGLHSAVLLEARA